MDSDRLAWLPCRIHNPLTIRRLAFVRGRRVASDKVWGHSLRLSPLQRILGRKVSYYVECIQDLQKLYLKPAACESVRRELYVRRCFFTISQSDKCEQEY